MSTIDSAICDLERLITENHVEPKVEDVVKKVIADLSSRTVLILEWNGADVQKVAREKLSFLEDCKIEEIKENPLTEEQVIDVITHLDKYYDCNYGIDWGTINCALDNIVLPGPDLCRIKNS